MILTSYLPEREGGQGAKSPSTVETAQMHVRMS